MRWSWRKSVKRAPTGNGGAARRSRRLFLEQFEPRELLTTISINPTADNTIYQDKTGNSDGIGTSLFAGVANGIQLTNSPRRALLLFDVAGSIPAGAHIDSATLQLHDIKNKGVTTVLGVYPLLASWGEGASSGSGDGAAASANDATWVDRFHGPSNPPEQAWQNAGGDFKTAPTSTTTITNSFAFYQWTGLAADVQGWLDSPNTQFGWLLKATDESSGPTAQEFDSRESLTTANRPTLTINYTIANAAPVIAGPASASVAHGGTFNFTGANTLSVSDSDGGSSTESVALSVTSGTLTLNTTGVSVTSGGSGSSAISISGTLTNLNNALASLSYTAPISGASATLSATANDGTASSNVLNATITLQNVAPAVTGPGNVSVAHGAAQAFTGSKLISISDTDGGSSTESIALSVTSGTLTLNATGVNVISGSSGTSAVTISGTVSNLNTVLATLSYAAPNSGSLATLSATASDGTSSSNTLTTTITLTNAAPAIAGPPAATVPRGSVFNFTGANTISASDIDAGNGTESIELSVTLGTLSLNTTGVNVTSGGSGTSAVTISGSLANVNTALATLAYTAPTTGTSATLTATANDGSASSTALTIAITLTSQVNQPPTIDSIADAGVVEDAGQQTINLTGITAGLGDVQALSAGAVSDNPGLIDPTVHYTSPNSTGSITFTPAAGQTGTATIVVTVRDAGLNGTLGDDDDGIISKSFVVHVLSPDQINHAPSFTIGPDQAGTDESGEITIPEWATQISPGPSQESSQTISFLVTTDEDPLHPLLAATPAVDSSGTLTFTPAPNAHGIVHISVRAHDSGGTLAGGVDTSDPQTFAITITKPRPWHNTALHLDVDGDGHVVPKDLVVLIIRLNGFGATAVPDNAPIGPPYYDVDNDLNVAPKDLVAIISHLNGFGAGEGEAAARAASATAIQPAAADTLLTEFDPFSAANDPLQPRRRLS